MSSDYENVRGHRLLEVFNPDTQHWEVWDPDYGVVYQSTLDDRRVDITTLVFDPLDHIEPRQEGKRGWDENNMGEIRAHYFQAVLFEHPKDGMKNALILINPARLGEIMIDRAVRMAPARSCC